MIPGVFFLMQNEPTQRFLQAQRIFLPQVALVIVAGSLHILWCHLFINVAGLGVVGAGVAFSLTHVLLFVISVSFITITKMVGEAWFCIGKESFFGFR